MLIYSEKKSNRLSYILDFFFNDLIGIEYELTHNIQEFSVYENLKLNYSKNNLGGGVFVYANDFIYENRIREFIPDSSLWNNLPALFLSPVEADLPFDVFSASFYLISRYEEYLLFKRDNYHRFPARESIAYRKNFLEKPVVNIWAGELFKIFQTHKPDLKIPDKKTQFISTIDIDNAFAYKGKGLFRTLGAFAKSIVRLNMSDFFSRLFTVCGLMHDKYNTYEYIKNIHLKNNINPIFFVLVGNNSRFDRNVMLHKKIMKKLLVELSSYAEIGIHPSYKSNRNIVLQKQEIAMLSKIIGKPITKSRQHFLKLSFPETYRKLVVLGITSDYSMGYATHPGFRASVCTPFLFFDIEMDSVMNLTIYPFVIMDRTLNGYMKMNSDRAIAKILDLMKKVKSADGIFVNLWHNESLSNKGMWSGWRSVYESMFNN